ncbi:lipocalin family protein [Cohnella fermenti]|nr:lipocalin family protein [Cohnella fermenti]
MPRLPASISLPEDASGHPFSNVEWWYAYALLTGSRGRRYAVMASFFRVGELLLPKGHYAIHSFIDLDRGRSEPHSLLDRMLAYQMATVYLPVYLTANPLDGHTWGLYKQLLGASVPAPHRLLPGGASVAGKPTRIVYGENSLSFEDDASARLRLELASETARLRLRFEPAKPVALIDEVGKVNGLKYYSATRNEVAGELYREGRFETVRGEGWFDHQWGRHYGLLRGEGWDWFGLQLRGGRELLISRLRPANPREKPYSVAKLIRPDGSVATTERVTLRPERVWSGEWTKAEYPVEWSIELPEFAVSLRVSPLTNRQEMPILGPLQAIWEGACAASGTARTFAGKTEAVEGFGFMELVGYARA